MKYNKIDKDNSNHVSSARRLNTPLDTIVTTPNMAF